MRVCVCLFAASAESVHVFSVCVCASVSVRA